MNIFLTDTTKNQRFAVNRNMNRDFRQDWLSMRLYLGIILMRIDKGKMDIIIASLTLLQ